MRNFHAGLRMLRGSKFTHGLLEKRAADKNQGKYWAQVIVLAPPTVKLMNECSNLTENSLWKSR